MKEYPSQLRVYLFGKFAIERGGQTIIGFEARRLQEVFSYLLLNPCRRCAREFLANLFWKESSTEQGRKNLRQILWQLQAALEADETTASERILSITPDWIQINPQANLWTDVRFFTQVWDQTRDIPGKDLSDAAMQRIRHAIALHQETLLPDNYEDWCLRERSRFLVQCVAMLEKLMEYEETHHNYEAALRSGRRILDFDPSNEGAHQRLMHLYYALGKRVEALKQYRQCKTALLEDLGALPSKSTQLLYQRILLDQLESETDKETGTFPLEYLLQELQAIQFIQHHAQSQIGFHVQRIEQLLHVLVETSGSSNHNLPLHLSVPG